jgi:phosphoribosylaminoimidazole-succinocarboxamide synthase
VRDYLETLDWDKTAPGPELPDDVRDGTAARYRDAYNRITGADFGAYLHEMGVPA